MFDQSYFWIDPSPKINSLNKTLIDLVSIAKLLFTPTNGWVGMEGIWDLIVELVMG